MTAPEPAALDQYIRRWKRLRSDTSAARWTDITRVRAPHKPLLLLALVHLIERKQIATNVIRLDEPLTTTFRALWRAVLGDDMRRATPAMPFWHLQSDGFWHFAPRTDIESVLQHLLTRRSPSANLIDTVLEHAYLDDDLWCLLQAPDARTALTHALIDQYFAPTVHPALRAVLDAPEDVL